MGKYDNVDVDKVDTIKTRIENNSRQIDSIVDEIISPYIKELDDYVNHIDSRLCQKDNPPTDSELESFCLNLSTLIYSAGSGAERLGIKEDIAKTVYKEVYNNSRDSISKGTVADKNSTAELAALQEQLVSICYSRACKVAKTKVEFAMEILSACKKAVSRRMAEQQLTNMAGN